MHLLVERDQNSQSIDERSRQPLNFNNIYSILIVLNLARFLTPSQEKFSKYQINIITFFPIVVI